MVRVVCMFSKTKSRNGAHACCMGIMHLAQHVFARFCLQEKMRRKRAEKLAQKKVSGGAAGLVAGKRRREQLGSGGLEGKARRLDDDEIQAEIRSAVLTASKGDCSTGGGPVKLREEAPDGFTVRHVRGKYARAAVLEYELVLHMSAAHGDREMLAVGSLQQPATDAELLASWSPPTDMQVWIDRVLHIEHWTAQQRKQARSARLSDALILTDPRGCSVSLLAWAAAGHTDFDILIVHTRNVAPLFWRRQQLAEVLWHHMQRTLPQQAVVRIECACCQAGAAGRFWTRLGFLGSQDMEKRLDLEAKGKLRQAIMPGDYAMFWFAA